MKKGLLLVAVVLLLWAGTSYAAQYATGLILPPLQELQKQFENQARIVYPILEAERRIMEEYLRIFGPLPETNMRRNLPSVNAPEFDWAALGMVTEVKNQNPCGSCYIFGPIAAYEASYLIRNGSTIDASEQALLDVAITGCNPGWVYDPLTWLTTRGTAREADYGYTAAKGSYRPNIPTPYKALAWAFVGRGITTPPTRMEIKEALLRHGPLMTSIYASPAFQNYPTNFPSGIFREHLPNDTNHMVTIIGWSEQRQAWKIKNSWGKQWGYSGFGWVGYESNKIGSFAIWVEARCDLLDRMPQPGAVVQAFEDELGKFRVRLDGGTATYGTDQVTLRGTATIGQTGAQTTVTVRGELTLQKRTGPAGPVSGSAGVAGKPEASTRVAVGATVGASPAHPAWVSGSGNGIVELRVGNATLYFRRASVELMAQADGNLAFGLRDSLDGQCSTTVGGGASILTLSDASLSFSDQCPTGWNATGNLRMTSNSATGSGILRAFGQSFDISYALKDWTTIEGKGIWRGGQTGWKPVPNVTGAEFRVVGPSIQVAFTYPTPSIKATLSAPELAVQTTAKKPNGTPWAYAKTNIPPVEINLNGDVFIGLPTLPAPVTDLPQIFDAMCDATCGTLRGLGLAAAVPDGTGFQLSGVGASLKYVDGWHNQCEIWKTQSETYWDSGAIPPGYRTRSVFKGSGDCKNDTVCPPGQERFDDGGVKKCRTIVPQPPPLPTLPRSITIKAEVVIQ